MNCNQVKDNLSSFVDNELNNDQTNAIKAHLIRCDECRQTRDELENMGQMIRQIPPTTTPPDFQFRVYSAIRRRESTGYSRSFFRWQTLFLPIAAMVIGIFIGLSAAETPMDSPSATMSANTNITDNFQTDENNVIRNYNLDSYVRRPLIPVNVDTIPDENNPDSENKSRAKDQKFNQAQYVLDNVPLRVNYERTIY